MTTVVEVTVAKKRVAPKPGVIKDLAMDDIAIDGTDHRFEELADSGAVDELAASMASEGQLQAIRVREPSRKNGKWLIVFGRRRFLAAKKMGWKTIRAEVMGEVADVDAITQASIENVQRAALNQMEEAAAVTQMLDSLATAVSPKVTGEAAIKTVADRLGKSATWVRDRSYLARLKGKARTLVLEGRLPLQHAREIAKLVDPGEQDEVAEWSKCDAPGVGGRSLDYVKSNVAAKMMSLKMVPWKLDEKFAGGPACSTCPHNSANSAALFEHDKKKDVPETAAKTMEDGQIVNVGVCLHKKCFERKRVTAARSIDAGVIKAVKLVKKDEAEATATGLADVAPDGIKLSSFVRAVKRETDRGGSPAKTASSNGAASGSKTKQLSPEEVAKGKADAAAEVMLRALQKQIFARCKTNMGVRLMVELLFRCDAWTDAANAYNPGQRAKALRNPALVQAIKLLESPGWEGAIKLADTSNFNEYSVEFSGYIDREPLFWPALQRLAKSLKLELGDRPKAADFVTEKK